MFFKAPLFSAEQYRKIIDSASEGIWMVDCDGITLFANQALANMLGYKVEELLGRSSFDFFLFDDSTSFEPFVINLDSGKIERYEIKLLQRNKKHCWVLLGSSPILDESGTKTGSIFMLTDITERKHSEKLISEQKAKIAHQGQLSALGEMASGIAHEINTPLSTIIGRVECLKILASKSDSVSSSELIEKLDAIEVTAFRIGNIIKSMRAVARSAEGMPFEVVTVSDTISDALLLCGESFRSSDVKIELPEPAQLKFECRPIQISQVLLNLMSNAYQAIVASSDPWIRIEIQDLGSSISISVTDSGSGIPKSVANRIMEPFYTTKEVGKGTGLGLSISANIIAEHGGSLSLNTECRNTQFVITLPKTQPSIAGIEQKSNILSPKFPSKILA